MVEGPGGDAVTTASIEKAKQLVPGKTIKYDYIPRDVFARFPFKGADDLADMFEFYRRRYPDRRNDIERSRALYPHLKTFEQWIWTRADRLP